LVEAGKIKPGSVLIVESLDRFSRNTVREVLPDFLSVINAGRRATRRRPTPPAAWRRRARHAAAADHRRRGCLRTVRRLPLRPSGRSEPLPVRHRA
jgi:hypothetical protein